MRNTRSYIVTSFARLSIPAVRGERVGESRQNRERHGEENTITEKADAGS